MDTPSPINPPPRRKLMQGIRFRTTVPPVHDDGSPINEEWGLRCPNCDYDLTGLPGRVCPECGRQFDPHAIWRARRDKMAAESMQAPAYIIYGVLVIVLLICLRKIIKQPAIVLPLAVMPLFELTAFFLKKNAGASRSILMVLSIIACITWWSMI